MTRGRLWVVHYRGLSIHRPKSLCVHLRALSNTVPSIPGPATHLLDSSFFRFSHDSAEPLPFFPFRPEGKIRSRCPRYFYTFHVFPPAVAVPLEPSHPSLYLCFFFPFDEEDDTGESIFAPNERSAILIRTISWWSWRYSFDRTGFVPSQCQFEINSLVKKTKWAALKTLFYSFF